MQFSVKVYALSTCIHCRNTKKFLNDCSVEYECTDVDLLSGEERVLAIQEIRKINPECSFPTIIIGNKVIIGFKEAEIRETLGL